MHNYDYTKKDDLLLKKQLNSISREFDEAILNLNFLQDKLFKNLKKLDDKKHKIYLNEYNSNLKYLKEELRKSKNFQTDEALWNSEIYKKEILKSKINLSIRLQLNDEFENLCLEGLDIISNSKKDEKILPKYFKNESSFGNKKIQSDSNFKEKNKFASLSDIAKSFPNFQPRHFQIHAKK